MTLILPASCVRADVDEFVEQVSDMPPPIVKTEKLKT